MKIIRFALTLGTILVMIAPCVADIDTYTDQGPMDEQQMDQPQMDQGMMDQGKMDQGQMTRQSFNATVKAGPRLKAALPPSADVYVSGKFAIRIPASAAGMSPMERANVIADRLNVACAQGMSWQDTQVLARDGMWAVYIGDTLIVTADANSARALNTQTGQLAGMWARQSVIAMGGQPQMIARQLMPITSAVAGSMEELGGAAWMVAPIKGVQLISVASQETMGNVTVAGAQTNLDKVTSVALYAYADGNANVYLFVPASVSTIMASAVPRVMGVGLVRLPASIVPMTDILTGDQAIDAIDAMSSDQWNAALNSRLAGWRIQFQATTKVVPLYSLSMNHIVGAAQVVGTTTAIARTNAVVVSTMGDNLSFGATSTAPSDISGRTATMNNVVVSGIIVFPSDSSFTSPMSLME